ncbi:MAG: Nramp family divalent metal transporter [Bryobacterales bacterium]|nr:Nramp family divalent metal transporter [Bryobacterales bacterium]
MTRHPPSKAPKGLIAILANIGPSLILTANVVGSGELIMTTALGASAGFVALWVILVSCAVKVAVQLEFGKHAIASGETSMRAFNRLPGPRIRGVSWSVWVWLAVKLVQLVQYGGIVGAVAATLHLAFPGIAENGWVWACGAAAAALVWRGGYRFIENAAIALTATFSVVTVACALMLQWTPYRISLTMLASGLSFDLPAAAVGIAVAAFGLTGVSADEIISYPYWCIEKGYASRCGPPDGTPEWTERARGWIRVMYVDAAFSLVVYTVTTAAFYLLGASVLHGRGPVPEGSGIISALSAMYTEVLGPGAMALFLAGAATTLFSTLFVACASSTRMFTDAFAQLGLLRYEDKRARQRWLSALAWLLPLVWTLLFLFVRAPLVMVAAGGAALAGLLVVVAFAAQHFRYRRLPRGLRPSPIYDLLLWTSILAILGVGIRSLLA